MRIVIVCAGIVGFALMAFAALGELVIDSQRADAIAWLSASAYAGAIILVFAALAMNALSMRK